MGNLREEKCLGFIENDWLIIKEIINRENC